MGKTSVARELGRRLAAQGWIFLFADVEGATCPEDVIAEIAQAVHPHPSIASRFAATMRRWFSGNVEEINALDFRIKFRAGLDAGSWRRHGENLLRHCAEHDQQVLLVVDEFLSWLRGVLQTFGDASPVLVISGSIGLEPLVKRLGIPDRINYLHTFRLGPWSRDASVSCFRRLAASYGLPVEAGVPNSVYEALGVGIPHHVQAFFAQLRDNAIMQGLHQVTVADVGEVYRTKLLGPWGQSDLVHYETRLREGLDDDGHRIAMDILAEAATQEAFTPRACRCLERLHARLVDDAAGRIADTLDILVHDGYLEAGGDGHRFPSRLLQDWWSARFRDHHAPLEARCSNDEGLEKAP